MIEKLILNSESRSFLSEYVGEFIGTMVLCIFGIGVNCQVILSKNPQVTTSPAGVRFRSVYLQSETNIMISRIGRH